MGKSVSLYGHYSQKLKINFSVYYYASASTESAVFILGGSNYQENKYCDNNCDKYCDDIDCPVPGSSTRVAQFKDDSWSWVGSLHRGRISASSITINGITMILGGYPKPESEE